LPANPLRSLAVNRTSQWRRKRADSDKLSSRGWHAANPHIHTEESIVKKLIATLLLSSLVSAPVFAADAPPPPAKKPAPHAGMEKKDKQWGGDRDCNTNMAA
jgi:hypothetical protein